ncbi:type II secretion system F family protein [Corynebacterium otitidis]
MITLVAALAAAVLLLGPPKPARRLPAPERGAHPAKQVRLRMLGALVAVVLALGAAGLGPAPVAAAAILSATGLWLAARARAARRGRRRARLAADFLGHLCGQLRAGRHPEEAARRAAAATAPSRGDEHELGALAAAAAGREPAAGCGDAPRRLAALAGAAGRHGIGLAALAGALQERVERAAADEEALRASLAGPQATAAILTALPLGGLGLGQAMGASPVAFLLGDPLGGALLVAGCALLALGAAWSRLICEAAAR